MKEVRFIAGIAAVLDVPREFAHAAEPFSVNQLFFVTSRRVLVGLKRFTPLHVEFAWGTVSGTRFHPDNMFMSETVSGFNTSTYINKQPICCENMHQLSSPGYTCYLLHPHSGSLKAFLFSR